jgi:hypothetical protein
MTIYANDKLINMVLPFMKEERYSDRVLREIRSVENEVVLPFIKKRGDFDRVLGQNWLVKMGSLSG